MDFDGSMFMDGGFMVFFVVVEDLIGFVFDGDEVKVFVKEEVISLVLSIGRLC